MHIRKMCNPTWTMISMKSNYNIILYLFKCYVIEIILAFMVIIIKNKKNRLGLLPNLSDQQQYHYSD